MERKSNEFIAIGLMLFALFFGAGNLIFPVFMGQNSGLNTVEASIGFLITGVGLPLLGILAVCYSGQNLRDLSSRVSPIYGLIFSIVLYLTIGPFFAIPRTATVSYEIAVAQFVPADMKTFALYAFAFVFFVISWYLAVSPSKLVKRVGKYITPFLLIFLAILIVTAFIYPMGNWQAPAEAYNTAGKAFGEALTEGYNTMDALASLVFGVLVVQSIRMYGAKTEKEVAISAFKSGLVSTFFMAIIYASLCYIGANSVSTIGLQENGAPVLVKVSAFYFGPIGAIILGVIVILACLTTSIGLIASCAAYFNLLFPKISHKNWATIFSVVSFGVALFGLSAIIAGAIPVLMFLYPLTISLIILTFLNNLFNGARCVYACATAFTIIPALHDAVTTAGINTGSIGTFMTSLPLANFNIGWLNFFVVGFVIGYVWMLAKRKSEVSVTN